MTSKILAVIHAFYKFTDLKIKNMTEPQFMFSDYLFYCVKFLTPCNFSLTTEKTLPMLIKY